MTKLFGIVGDPIEQVRSPEVFNRLFQERGVDALMVPMLIRPANFEEALAGLRAIDSIAGVIVTVPHKAAAARLMKVGAQRAKLAQTANALRPCPGGWEGELFDGEGFVRGLEAQGFVVEAVHCAVVGCGGAGTAIAFALLQRQVASLSIWDIDKQKAQSLCLRLRAMGGPKVYDALPDGHTDIAINATPLGMKESDPIPIAVDSLRTNAIVAEAIMKPACTRLLREAKRRGCTVHAGRHMLDHQVEAIWRFFLPHVEA
jgi:shikimate dehydrogenase